MSWGALLTTETGNAFITPESTPIALHSKMTVSSTSSGGTAMASGSMPIPDIKQPVVPVVYSTQPTTGQVALNAAVAVGGVLAFSGTNIFNTPFSVTCFLFTWFQQPIPNPAWGMAIWDASGKLVLTHQTKVLTDLVSLGQQGVDSNSGVNITTTLNGMYGIVTACTGQRVWRTNVGGFISSPVYAGAMYNGSSTTIQSAPVINPGPSVQPSGGVNYANSLTVLEVSRYL